MVDAVLLSAAVLLLAGVRLDIQNYSHEYTSDNKTTTIIILNHMIIYLVVAVLVHQLLWLALEEGVEVALLKHLATQKNNHNYY